MLAPQGEEGGSPFAFRIRQFAKMVAKKSVGAGMPGGCCLPHEQPAHRALTRALGPVAQKKSQESINSRLALVMKSGKFTLGTKTYIKCLRSGKGACFTKLHWWTFCSEIKSRAVNRTDKVVGVLGAQPSS